MSVAKAVTLKAHFDGEQIRLDDPVSLEPDDRLTVTVWPAEDEPERQAHLHLSLSGLQRAFGEDEPEYPADLIKDPNPEYAGG
jgi:hypothetical protein